MEDKLPIINAADEDEGLYIRQPSVEEDNFMTVDEVLFKTGPFGKSQFLVLAVCMLFSFSFSFQSMITYYTADDSPWACVNINTSAFCDQGPFKEGSDLFERRCQMHRDEWEYTYSKKYSIATEFDLVCSNEYLKASTTACFFAGCIVGGLISGPLGDNFGRKPVINVGFLLAFLASLFGYFINSVWQYLLSRVMIGVSFGSVSIVVFILLSEFNAPKSRGLAGNLYFIAFTLSQLMVSLVAFYVRNWRNQVLYTAFLPLVGFLLSLPLLESPQWLYVKGKTEKAELVLRKIATFNNKKIIFKLKMNEEECNEAKQYTYIHLFNNLKVFSLISLQSYLWFTVGLVFYGIALESSNLGGSLYTNFILSSLSDIPGYLIALFTSVYIGRKKATIVTVLIGGCMCGAIGFVPKNLSVLRVTFAILCRMFLTVTFNTQFLWTFEINPTVLRSQGMNVCQMISRVGSTATPFLTSVLQDANPKLPFFIMAAVCFLGAFVSLFLPEMINKPTRENYDDYFERDILVSPPKSSSVNSDDD